MQNISKLIENACNPTTMPRKVPSKSSSLSNISIANKTSANTIVSTSTSSHLRSSKSLSTLQRSSSLEQRRNTYFADARGSSSVFDSIDEDNEQRNVGKPDSGFQSCRSSRSHCTPANSKDRFTSISSISSVLERHDYTQTAPLRHVPHTVSLVAGVFIINIFENKNTSTTSSPPINNDLSSVGMPLLSFTISQPSFMITQNVYDASKQFSLFNLNVAITNSSKSQHNNLFPELVIDTRPGELGDTGIPPPLFSLKLHRTKTQLLELDALIGKPILINLCEASAKELFQSLLVIYEALLENPCFEVRTNRAVIRGSKIKLMRQQCFDADRLHFKCAKIVVNFAESDFYSCKLVCVDINLNLKFLQRPEKLNAKAGIGAIFLKTGSKIFVHPISLRLSADFSSEPWHCLPLVVATAKFNVVQLDVGIYALLQLRQASQSFKKVAKSLQLEWQQFLLNQTNTSADNAFRRELLSPLVCPPLQNCQKEKTSDRCRQQRVEFYQDDLRAGAFQFVEMVTDTFLPLPYQIQIIKKNYGIICWRYPQPRKMCKIHIYPVPMAVPNPIHIKCRMEYFSETHECFQHYCDFWLSETVSKQITLPEREICAIIWRVVIMQSLVSVNGDCFDTSEEDEAIASVKIDDVLCPNEPKESDFILHPKVLVGCMRIDTSFQSVVVPKVQLLVTCNYLQIKLLNQPNENGELPSLLKKFRLTETTNISQTFLVLQLERINFHVAFRTRNHYTIDSSIGASVRCIDYGFLNMLHLLEPTTLQSYIYVNLTQRSIGVNIVFDRLRVNFGPSMIHSLLSSKAHWEELLDTNTKRTRHALIPKCIVVNRTYSVIAFGQTGTTERITLQTRECHLYAFRSDYHSQELTFFISDDETHKTETSQSVPIRFQFKGGINLQPIRIGNKCIIIKSQKLSATQIFVLIKGQIEIISMLPMELRVELRREGKLYDDKNLLEYNIGKKGRCSLYRYVQRSSNIVMRLKFPNNKGKGRTGDIPLKTNKNLPWLVKVPTLNNEFISLWVRILREDIPDISNDHFQPQKVLITIWPIFVISSTLGVPINVIESTTKNNYLIPDEGGRQVLDVPATHLTDHHLEFKYNFPICSKSKSDYTLTLKTMEWNKFFCYDEQRWNIENTIHELAKGIHVNWPFNDEVELRLNRLKCAVPSTTVDYQCMPSREFACSMCLEVSPWGLFINATGLEVSIFYCQKNERVRISSNTIAMMSRVRKAFTIDVPLGSNWTASLPIYHDATLAAANEDGGRYYLLSEKDTAGIDIDISRNDEIFKFVLEYKSEHGRKIFRLRSKFAVTNFTKIKLCTLGFALDHKESANRKDVMSMDGRLQKQEIMPVKSLDNCIGQTLDCFYDINARKVQRSNDTPFVYFICIKICDESDCSIPIPLAMPFTRRCFSIQNGLESIPLMVTLIEKEGIFYLNIFEDISPAILVYNQTDVKFIVAQTSASENSNVSNTTPEYDGRHFEWYQLLPAYSKCYYTPPEMYASYPDVESTMCNLTLALCNDKHTKTNIKWSKPIRTDRTWEKFLHVPNHGDVKVIICDKHRVIRVSIYYIAQQMEFSVKDLRSRLQTPNTNIIPTLPLHVNAEDSSNQSISTLKNVDAFKPPPLLPSLKCIHFLNECETKNQLKLRIFVKEIVLNMHTDSKERDCMKCEVFGMYIDDFMFAYDDDDDRRQLNVMLPNLQLDNQLYSTGRYDFPVVLCAEEVYQRTSIVPKVHYLDRTYQELRSMSRSPMALFTFNYFEDELKIASIVCNLSPLRAYIEDAYLNSMFDVLVECTPSTCVYKPKQEEDRLVLTDGELLLPRDVVAQALCISEPLQLRSFRIEPLNVLLSVHTSVRMYIALDHSPLSFSTYERQQVLTVPLRFGQSLGMHYLSGAIFGAGWVVGSLEILGSPSGLARSFTTGLRDFISMPVQGLFRGPWGFIVGMTQGSASLLRNVTAGTVNSVTKLAASVARNLDRLSLDQEHIERTEALRRSRPQGFTEGFSQGITGLGISILGAVGGIARHTLEARSPVEVVTGMGKGIVGAFTKPISGAAELVALAGQGMLHTVGFNAMPHQRYPSVCHNIAVMPSGYRIWKLLPGVLIADQILFYHEVTVVVQEQLRRGYVFLTSAVFAITEAQWDKLALAIPVDKVEITCDRDDKTLIYVHRKKEKEDIEEDMSYTNERIMTFLRSSFSQHSNKEMTTDSLRDLLETPSHNNQQPSLNWAFYISEHLGEHIIQYLKIVNKKN